jgi:hypothetical protein
MVELKKSILVLSIVFLELGQNAPLPSGGLAAVTPTGEDSDQGYEHLEKLSVVR